MPSDADLGAEIIMLCVIYFMSEKHKKVFKLNTPVSKCITVTYLLDPVWSVDSHSEDR